MASVPNETLTCSEVHLNGFMESIMTNTHIVARAGRKFFTHLLSTDQSGGCCENAQKDDGIFSCLPISYELEPSSFPKISKRYFDGGKSFQFGKRRSNSFASKSKPERHLPNARLGQERNLLPDFPRQISQRRPIERSCWKRSFRRCALESVEWTSSGLSHTLR